MFNRMYNYLKDLASRQIIKNLVGKAVSFFEAFFEIIGYSPDAAKEASVNAVETVSSKVFNFFRAAINPFIVLAEKLLGLLQSIVDMIGSLIGKAKSFLQGLEVVEQQTNEELNSVPVTQATVQQEAQNAQPEAQADNLNWMYSMYNSGRNKLSSMFTTVTPEATQETTNRPTV